MIQYNVLHEDYFDNDTGVQEGTIKWFEKHNKLVGKLPL